MEAGSDLNKGYLYSYGNTKAIKRNLCEWSTGFNTVPSPIST